MCTGLEIAAVAGAGLSAASSISGGMASASDARLQAEVTRGNTKVAETEAQTRTVLAELPAIAARLEETRLRKAVEATLGTETAAYSAAGLDPSTGAPLLVAGVTAAQGQVDIAMTRAQGALGRAEKLAEAASGYAEAASSRFQTVRAENQAENQLTAGILGAGTAFLTGARSGGFGFGGGAASVTPTGGMY